MGAQSRYYAPDRSGVRCYNCDQTGHMSFDCPKPRKMNPCHKCGNTGHQNRDCPDDICFNCKMPGHVSRDCTGSRVRRWGENCDRCGGAGHASWQCADRWRQYHSVVTDSQIAPGAPDPRPLPTAADHSESSFRSCYNCGGDDHMGHQCRHARRTEWAPAPIPEVRLYDFRCARPGPAKTYSAPVFFFFFLFLLRLLSLPPPTYA